MSLPVAVSGCLVSRVVSFSGSRSVVPPVLPRLLLAVRSRSRVFVGCARGVDAAVRSGLPCPGRLSVFRVFGSGRGAFAARSVRFVRALSASGGVLFAFPGRACPSGLVPSPCSRSCFCGLGSGSWASVAFAVGLGVPVCLWLPSGLSVPASWGFAPVGGGWWVSW